MPRNLAYSGPARLSRRGVTSIACLVFVMLLALAFWAGALWIGNAIVRVTSSAL